MADKIETKKAGKTPDERDQLAKKLFAFTEPPQDRNRNADPETVYYNDLVDERYTTRPDTVDSYLRDLENSVKIREGIWPELTGLFAFSLGLLTADKFRSVFFTPEQWQIVFAALWLVAAIGLGKKVYTRLTNRLVTREQIMQKIRQART